jgi:hypothetical protein
MGLGLVLRLGFALGYWVGKPLTHDELEYLTLARSLAAGRGFSYDDRPAPDAARTTERFGRAPGYPIFLAGVFRLAGGQPVEWRDVPASIKVAQSVVGTFGIWIVSLIAGRLAGPRGAAVGAVLAAVYPPFVWLPAYALTEALYSVMALAMAHLLDLALDRAAGPPRSAAAPGLAIAAGALAGAGTLVRPAGLLFLLVAGPWLLWRRRGHVLMPFAVGVVVLLGPWTLRNYLEHGRVVIAAPNGGITFWTGNNPLARGEGDMAANPQIKAANLVIRERYPGLTPEQLEPVYYGEALAYIRREPLDWLALLARKLYYTWIPTGPSYRLHSTRYIVASIVPYAMILPFALAGAWRLRHHAAPAAGLWLLVASSLLVCLVFFPQERFRLPIVDPALIVCAATLAGRPPGARHAA